MASEFDYSALREKIRISYRTQAAFAGAVGLSKTSLNQKLCNKRPFSQNEIANIISTLGVKQNDIPKYFFTLKVHKSEQEV